MPNLLPKINVVKDNMRWVLGRMARGWAAHLPEATVTQRCLDKDADVYLYAHHQAFVSTRNDPNSKRAVPNIVYFTHRSTGRKGHQHWNISQAGADWCIAMCRKSAALLPPEKTSIIPSGVDPQFFRGRPLRIAVAGRDNRERRKRFGWIKSLERSVDGVEFVMTHGKRPWEDLPAFYADCDYYLCTSKLEGGPMPVLEALAMHKPVIAPDVGWCWDLPVIRYRDYSELESILRRLAWARGEQASQKAAAASILNVIMHVLEQHNSAKADTAGAA